MTFSNTWCLRKLEKKSGPQEVSKDRKPQEVNWIIKKNTVLSPEGKSSFRSTVKDVSGSLITCGC